LPIIFTKIYEFAKSYFCNIEKIILTGIAGIRYKYYCGEAASYIIG